MVSVGDEWALVWNVVVSVLLAALSILSAVLGFFRGGFNQSTGLSASGLGFVALGCLVVFMWVHLLRVCWSVIICIGEFSLWFMVWGFISVACCITGYLSRSLVDLSVSLLCSVACGTEWQGCISFIVVPVQQFCSVLILMLLWF